MNAELPSPPGMGAFLSVIDELIAITGKSHEAALGRRLELAARIVVAASGDMDGIRGRTSCLTLLAGAGTRWVASLAEAAAGSNISISDEELGLARAFPPQAPRGLFPVKNFIFPGPKYIPLAAYAVDAFRSLGRQSIVVRGWEQEITEQILSPLGIDPKKVAFFTQEPGPAGKVLGHGDATYQARSFWSDKRYLIVNFGGDANSPLTAMSGLCAMALLEAGGIECGLLLPVARIPGSAYPMILDAQGFPRSFGHDKLTATPSSRDSQSGSVSAYANVGIRIYRTDLLLQVMEKIRAEWWEASKGYSIPGNDPGAHEFALDNADALLAKAGMARIFPIANPDELTPAKKYGEVGRFEAAVSRVRAEWAAFSLRFQ